MREFRENAVNVFACFFTKKNTFSLLFLVLSTNLCVWKRNMFILMINIKCNISFPSLSDIAFRLLSVNSSVVMLFEVDCVSELDHITNGDSSWEIVLFLRELNSFSLKDIYCEMLPVLFGDVINRLLTSPTY